MDLPRPVGAALDGVGVRLGRTTALDGATFDVRPGTITGLLGRNGSGKTTALSLLAAFRRPSSGRVTIDGRDPFDDAALMPAVCLVRESGDVIPDQSISDTFSLVGMLRPTWDQRWAEELLEHFGIGLDEHPNQLSRGKRSVVGAVVGLASRAPLTMFDEVHLGMDAPTRVEFYDLLVADYAEHPRTIVISSHLISEIENVLEDVVLLDVGRVLHSGGSEELRARGATLTGRTEVVREASADLTVLSERTLGPTTELTVLGTIDHARRAELAVRGVGVSHVSLQDIVIHLTGSPS
ncbi:ATP-binding cassette domain-containing protein [Georgenia sp. Z1491]|uniref:ATP-binding cassette domain-containing protein n=1 Tax=Georgenia sp. Z1491 TaxID=3416707 RepID=UPI003CE7341D